jgi:competence protein ComEA
MTRFKTLILGSWLASFSLLALASPVNVNTADAKTIASSLKGVGPAKAQAIVTYREQHGPYKTQDDLLKVKGLGPKILEMNKQDIQLQNTK